VPTKQADPQLPLTTLQGVTRTLDDLTTLGHLALVVLPSWPEAQRYVTLGRRAFKTFREADCKTAWMILGNAAAANRVLGSAVADAQVFLDADSAVARSLGIERVPAFVHVKSDCSVAAVADGWDPAAWQAVADSLATAMRWTKPVYPQVTDPDPFLGWNV
jgi:hypothetical protein